MPGDDRLTGLITGLITEHLADPGSGWSMGTQGAIAEFVRDTDEPAAMRPGAVVTDRGGIRLDAFHPALRAVAYETPAGPHDHWNHAVALCLPTGTARCATRTAVTELGADRDALRAEDRSEMLFDLGLGTPTVDVCVRATDPSLLGLLRSAAGRPLFAEPATAARVAAASPHRVFRTALGRLEVYAAIPPAAGRSPDGPHTHLLPHLLRTGRTHPPTVPIPTGLVPVAHLYPAHPRQDLAGRPIPFDVARHRAFQRILAEFGDPALAVLKAEVTAAARAGRAPGPHPEGPAPRATVAVALRQLAQTEDLDLSAWAHGRRPPPQLLDPDGDLNAGH